MNQPQAYMCPLPLEPPSYLPLHLITFLGRALQRPTFFSLPSVSIWVLISISIPIERYRIHLYSKKLLDSSFLGYVSKSRKGLG